MNGATLVERGSLDESKFSYVVLPPTLPQRRLAVAVGVALLLAFVIIGRFTATQLPRIDAFIPTFETTVFVTDLITSVLLFSQFSIYRSRAILALASGYLFTALIVIPHALTFPNAFSATGLLGAGLQSTSALYNFWHIGFALSVLAYAWLKDEQQTLPQRQIRSAIIVSSAIVISLVCGLTWLATAGDEFMPRLFLDRTHLAPAAYYVSALNGAIASLALVLLWVRRRSVLDQWLIVLIIALMLELAETTFLSTGRFSLGFYAGRLFSLFTSTVVLIVLLTETTRLYAGLARSNMMLQRERDNKLMNLEAMTASIAHEVRQPLAAIATSGNAALRFLGRTPPDHEEVRSSLNTMISDSHRASQVFDNIRALFGKADKGQEPLDVNEIILEVLRTLRGELKDRVITVRTELTSELPLIKGHRGQLQEVLLNLVRNAIESMDAIKDGRRVLQVRTMRHDDQDEIVVAVEDSGPGIDPEKLDGIFDAFVSTKSQGMGLGLAICRMIIDRHGGQLSASSGKKRGAVFQFILPTKPAAGQIVQTA